MRWLIDAYVRWRYPGWIALVLVSCGSSDRTACYGRADLWLVDQADACEARGYAWEDCPERPMYLKQHRELEAACP